MPELQICPKGHRSESKICLECGHVHPLGPDDSVGVLSGATLLRSCGDANLYLVSHADQVLALWECRESFQPDYRQQLFQHLEQPVPGLLPIVDHHIEDTGRGGNLLYFLQSGRPYRRGQSLDQFIQQEGIPDPELSQLWIGQLLAALEGLEAQNFCLNGFASPLLQISEGQIWLSFPAWGDKLEHEQTLAPRVIKGFSPPVGQRTGLLYAETDRFGLAMVMFHLLTGLSPALWHPDLPKLRAYQYLWGKEAVSFFQALLAPRIEQSITELIQRWQNIKLSLNPETLIQLRSETRLFYRAVNQAAAGESEQALQALQEISEPALHNPHIHRLLGDLYTELNQGKDAVQAYGESLRRERLGCTYLQLGRFYLASKAPEHAAQAFRCALRTLPDEPEPYWQLGRLELEQARFGRAERWLQQAERLRPSREVKDLRARLELASRAGSGAQASRSGFLLRTESWDEPTENVRQSKLASLSEIEAVAGPAGYPILAQLSSSSRHAMICLAQNKGQQVLLKVRQADDTGRERQAREVRALQKLRAQPEYHSRQAEVPELLASFESRGRLYLVQSLMPGQNLETLVREQGPMPETEVREILSQGLKLLTRLADLNLIHGDIKPANLLWDSERQHLSLIDFDISVLDDGHEHMFSPGMSAHFAAPEQRWQGLVNQQTDAFSLGLSMVFLLTGLSPEHFLYHQPEQTYRHWQDECLINTELTRFLTQLLVIPVSRRSWQNSRDLLTHWQELSTGQVFNTVPEARKLLIQAAYRLHSQPQAAETDINLMLALRPDARSHYLIGQALLRRGYQQKARPYLNTALVLDPEWPYAYWDLADLACSRQRWGQALELLEQALHQSGELPPSYLRLGRIHRQLGSHQQALQAFAQGLRRSPQDPDLLLEEAQTLVSLEAFEPAQRRCEQVLRLRPGSSRAYQLLHLIAALRRQPAAAIDFGKRAIALSPDKASLYTDLGLTCYRFNRFREACDWLQQGLSLDAEAWDAHYYLGSSQFLLGQLSLAEHHLRASLKSNRHRPAAEKKLSAIARARRQAAS